MFVDMSVLCLEKHGELYLLTLKPVNAKKLLH